MATLKSRVLQILGENNSTYLDAIPNAEIIFEDAVWDMVSSLPRRFLSATATEPVDPENIPLDSGDPTYQNTQASPVNVKDKLILNVLGQNQTILWMGKLLLNTHILHDLLKK